MLISWVLLCSGSATAAPLLYKCKISHVYNLSNSGTLNISSFQKSFEGGEFTVSKSDGSIKGVVLTTIKAKATKVLNSGSAGFSFKAIAYFENQLVQLIDIQEFRSGKNKPFVASSMGGARIVSGMCQ